MARSFWVYILTNRSGTLYTGVTNNVARRLAEHKEGTGFTARYAIDRLVYAEEHGRAEDAIAREKQIKGWRRSKKVALVNTANPGWKNLARSDDAWTSAARLSSTGATRTARSSLEVPELPGCMSDGASYAEAAAESAANAEDAARTWIETALELGRAIPAPTLRRQSLA